MIGKKVAHYTVLEHIGGGGMGVVYKARDSKLKRIVALKFIPPVVALDPATKERFIREAQAASALQHNNICAIHEINESDDGRMYIVMDYYEGESLKLKIEKGKLKIEEAIKYIIQIARGLQKAHEKGIIHRDIKPANIIISESGEVKILDFGLSKVKGQSEITKTASTPGTITYMSPEQIWGAPIDLKMDIWSLGVVFYELITGKRPFQGEVDQAILYSISKEDPTPASAIRNDIPKPLEQIIDKMLQKNPKKRYQSIDEPLPDLSEINEGKNSNYKFGSNRKKEYDNLVLSV